MSAVKLIRKGTTAGWSGLWTRTVSCKENITFIQVNLLYNKVELRRLTHILKIFHHLVLVTKHTASEVFFNFNHQVRVKSCCIWCIRWIKSPLQDQSHRLARMNAKSSIKFILLPDRTSRATFQNITLCNQYKTIENIQYMCWTKTFTVKNNIPHITHHNSVDINPYPANVENRVSS